MFNWFSKKESDDKRIDALTKRIEIMERRINNHGADIRQLIRSLVQLECSEKKPVGRPKKDKKGK